MDAESALARSAIIKKPPAKGGRLTNRYFFSFTDSSDKLPITAKARSIANTGRNEPVFVRMIPDRVATNEVGISVRFIILKFSG